MTITCLEDTEGVAHPWDEPAERGGACRGNSPPGRRAIISRVVWHCTRDDPGSRAALGKDDSHCTSKRPEFGEGRISGWNGTRWPLRGAALLMDLKHFRDGNAFSEFS